MDFNPDMCNSHKEHDNRIENLEIWRKEHMKEHKNISEQLTSIEKSIWKFFSMVLAFNGAIATIFAITYSGYKMGWWLT